jgi:hypothetical protein
VMLYWFCAFDSMSGLVTAAITGPPSRSIISESIVCPAAATRAMVGISAGYARRSVNVPDIDRAKNDDGARQAYTCSELANRFS